MFDYETTAVSRLTGQFEGSPKLRAIVAAIVSQLTTLETVADSLMSDRWIDTAIGAQLDGCGYIVGEQRSGRDDEAYRKAIKFRVFVNVSKGTPDNLVDGLRFLTNPTDTQYQEAYPATTLLFTNGYFVDYTIQNAMQDISPAGISTVPVAVSFAGRPFRFSKSPPPGELFVNNAASYLTADGSDIQVTTGGDAAGDYALGGVVPAEIEIGGAYLDIGGPTLAVYNPEMLQTLGHDNLTGVFQ